jgi:RNA polymerase sigma-70 factor, ECF subfamily
VTESKSVRTIDTEQHPVNEVPSPQTSFIIGSGATGRLVSNRMDIQVSLTERLQSFSGGDREIAEAVLRQVLPKLHQIAVRELRRERYVAPLSPTELIHEVWLRNLGKGGWQINGREHFYAIAALAMRRVLIDFARQRLAQRRDDGGKTTTLDENVSSSRAHAPDLDGIVQVGLLMDKLERANPQAARVVDMHYFAGFTLQEVSDIMGLTLRQARHLWEKGRDWLKQRV